MLHIYIVETDVPHEPFRIETTKLDYKEVSDQLEQEHPTWYLWYMVSNPQADWHKRYMYVTCNPLPNTLDQCIQRVEDTHRLCPSPREIRTMEVPHILTCLESQFPNVLIGLILEYEDSLMKETAEKGRNLYTK